MKWIRGWSESIQSLSCMRDHMNINLEYYKVFYYVCQEGSLTAAAQRLCISQPAVSQAVRQLEKEAGAKLS